MVDRGQGQATGPKADDMQGYIERMGQSGEFQVEATKEKLTSVFGSFLGECSIRYYRGVWTQREGVWCVAFEGDNLVFPFAKVSKQMEHGLEDSIGSFISCCACGIQRPCSCATAPAQEAVVEILVSV